VFWHKSPFDNWKEISLNAIQVLAKLLNLAFSNSVHHPIWFDKNGNVVFYNSEEDAKIWKFNPSFNMKAKCDAVFWHGDRLFIMLQNLEKKDPSKYV
jgi:hypothetical protein